VLKTTYVQYLKKFGNFFVFCKKPKIFLIIQKMKPILRALQILILKIFLTSKKKLASTSELPSEEPKKQQKRRNYMGKLLYSLHVPSFSKNTAFRVRRSLF
jgi:hypothetical protein